MDFLEVQEGLKKMDHLHPRIHISNDDYQRMTRNGSLCDPSGQLDLQGFNHMFREEIEGYAFAKIAQALDDRIMNERVVHDATLIALKLLLMRTGKKGLALPRFPL